MICPNCPGERMWTADVNGHLCDLCYVCGYTADIHTQASVFRRMSEAEQAIKEAQDTVDIKVKVDAYGGITRVDPEALARLSPTRHAPFWELPAEVRLKYKRNKPDD